MEADDRAKNQPIALTSGFPPAASKSKSQNTKSRKGGNGLTFSNWSIGKKVATGFIVAIGISTLGAVVGLVIGNSHLKSTREARQDIMEELHVIHGVESSLLRLEVSSARLGAREFDPELFRVDVSGFYENLDGLEKHIQLMQQISQESLVEESEEKTELIEELTDIYDQTLVGHFSKIEAVLNQFDAVNLQAEDIEGITALIGLLSQDNHANDVRNFVKTIRELEHVLEQEEEEVEDSTAQVIKLRNSIIAISLIISALLASAIAYWMSRAIANPLAETTAIAERVTNEEDFTLQAPVTTGDEVGVLTASLNKLINRVRKLLTERKAAEARLVQTEKMSSLGQLVAGIAHEINNPVNFIHGNLSHVRGYSQDLLGLVELYQKHYPNPTPEIEAEIEAIELDFMKEDFSKMLESMNTGSVRIRDIVKSLRTFSRLDEADVKEVDLHEGLNSTLVILHNRLKVKSEHPAIQVTKEYGNLPKVECYAGQMNQVFMNILSNAIDAIDEQNSRRTYNQVKENPSQIKISTTVIEGKYVEIRIADNGPGMSLDVVDKLFDPFFTTKPVGQGTGLGMAISHQIVTETHNGILTCSSDIHGGGAEFTIIIPIKQATAKK